MKHTEIKVEKDPDYLVDVAMHAANMYLLATCNSELRPEVARAMFMGMLAMIEEMSDDA